MKTNKYKQKGVPVHWNPVKKVSDKPLLPNNIHLSFLQRLKKWLTE